MSAVSVDVSDFVNVAVNVTPLAIPYQNFGLPLILGDSNVIDTNQRFRSYSNILGVGQDFGNTSPEFIAAQLFFAQAPQPAQCYIGRWASAATSGLLHGASLTTIQQALAGFNAIVSGSFYVVIDGVPHSITGLSFASALNLNSVAASISAAIAPATCVWDSVYGRFDVISSTTGVASSVSFIAPPTASGSATFSVNPANNDTLTINGTTVTFVTGAPVGNQVQIGGTLAITLASLLTFLQASQNAGLLGCTYLLAGSVLYVTAVVTGTGGNSIALAKVSTAIVVSGATLAGGSGVDISTLIGGTSASGASPLVQGIAAETLLTAVQALAGASTQWYGLSVDSTVQPATSDYLAVAAYILASSRTRIFGITIQGVQCLDPTQTNDLASQLQALNNKRVFWVYSSTNKHAILSIMGRAFTVNFNGNNSTITLAYKQAPGLSGENLTETQFATLQAKGGNVNIIVNNGAVMIWPGQMSNGYWFDEVHGVDWFQNRVQTDLFNLLYTTTTKVPQTDAGSALLAATIEGSCLAAINNGLVAPGTWQAAGFGALQQNGVLPKGFYVYYPPIASQSPALRVTRQSVVFQVAIKLAGAVHVPYVVLSINR